MSIRSKFRLGVSNDPNAAAPSLKEVLDTVLAQADAMMQEVLLELHAGDEGRKVHRLADLQHAGAREAAVQLESNKVDVGALFQRRLSDGLMHGGTVLAAPLRFDDLGLFGDEELNESVELARAQDEMSLAVDDVLPQLDAVMATLLGWRTPQPEINPLRPEIFVRALRETLFDTMTDAGAREALIVPAAGYMGVRMNALYREITDWLRSFGVEPALREGSRVRTWSGKGMSAVVGTVAQTMLTLSRLRHLLVGDLDGPAQERSRAEGEFGHTVPASYEVLQQLKQVETVLQRIERRSRADPSKAAARGALSAAAGEASPQASLGRQLAEEVVRLMFENLVRDARLLPAVGARLRAMEPHLQALAQVDSRFFSNRQHPARQLLDRITQRSLAYQSDADAGCSEFLQSVDEVLAKLGAHEQSAARFAELLAELDQAWAEQDEAAHRRGAEAAQALLHVEQRNLLAQRLAEALEDRLRQREVASFVADFLRGPWLLVMAESRLRNVEGLADPGGHEAVIEDLLWTVRTQRARQNLRRLAALIPGLLQRLRDGLAVIEYPEPLSSQFFTQLGALHDAVLEQRGGASALLDNLVPQDSAAETGGLADDELWVGPRETGESGFIQRQAQRPAALAQAGGSSEESQTFQVSDLRIGSWIELRIKEQWVRAQMTWASPHGTLFMFTSASGSAHSMSKRTMERLLGEGGIRIVAGSHLLDQALDRVADAALKNSIKR